MSAIAVLIWAGGVFGARTAKASWFNALLWPSSLGYAAGRYAFLAEQYIDRSPTPNTTSNQRSE